MLGDDRGSRDQGPRSHDREVRDQRCRRVGGEQQQHEQRLAQAGAGVKRMYEMFDQNAEWPDTQARSGQGPSETPPKGVLQ